jgi:hypothetical protein
MEDKLKPCPFCGSEAKYEYDDYDEETGEGDDGNGCVQCCNPLCGVGFHDWIDSAIEKWNQRVNK